MSSIAGNGTSNICICTLISLSSSAFSLEFEPGLGMALQDCSLVFLYMIPCVMIMSMALLIHVQLQICF